MQLCRLSSPPPSLQHVYNDVMLLWWCYHSNSTPSHLIVWRERHSRRRHHSCLIDGTVVEPNVLCKSKGSPFTLMGVYRQGILQPNKETWRLVCIVFLWDKLIRNILSCPLAQGGCDFISLCLLKSRDLSYALYVPQASSLKIYLILPLTVCHVKVILVIWCVFFFF